MASLNFDFDTAAHYSAKNPMLEDEKVRAKRKHRDLVLVELKQLLLFDSKQDEVVVNKDLSNKSPIDNGLKQGNSSRAKI
jgi:hypothetical protein